AIARIVKENGSPGTIVVVDGLFHTDLAVGHAELRAALRGGWTVWGVASMGAIRAREMSALGMKGYGEVYELYCRDGVDFRDDEVALLHGAAPEYAELSEPLVHMRAALAALVARGAVAEAVRAPVLAELEGMWFGDRTLPWLASRLRELVPAIGPEVDAALAGFDRYRIKSLDLIRFVRDVTTR